MTRCQPGVVTRYLPCPYARHTRTKTISFGSSPTTGAVEQIGLKTIRVRSLNGEEVVIFNAKLLEQQLQN